MLMLGTWLIALGMVFVIQQATRWSWDQAWPLWVIFVGVGGAGSALYGRRRARFGIWAIWWPLAVITAGIVLLLSTTGTIDVEPRELVAWWPLAVIGLGVWFLVGALLVRQPTTQSENLTIPIAGATAGDVRIKFGGGELTVGQAPAGALISGRFEGGVINRTRGPGMVDLEPLVGGWPMWWDRPLHWDVGVTGEIPVDLRLESGANRSHVDLSALRIRRLELKTGASETRVRLPQTGVTYVRAEAGVAAVTLEIPPGVSARVRSKMAIGTTSVDEGRFPRSSEGWASADFDTAPNRVDIEIQGGLGSVRVV
jgi:hypothetical protein